MFRIVLALLLMTTPAFAVTQWSKSIPAAGNSKSAWPGQVTAQWSIMDTLFASYRQGENLIFKNSTTVTVSSGQVVVSNSGASLRIFLSDSGNTDITSANLDTGGSLSASTTYYVYAAATSSTAASSTYYISLSSSAPTGPTYYFQLGSFITDGSGNITPQIVNNNVFFAAQLGSWSSKSVNVTYQASTDLWFTAYILNGSNSPGVTCYTDSNSSPSTLRFASYMSGTNGHLGCGTLVRKGDYYSATTIGTIGSSQAYILPIGT